MLSPQQRIRGAMLLVAVGAVGSARALPQAVQQCLADPKPDATAPFVARFEALKPLVRATPSLGYLSQAQNLDPKHPDPAKRLYLVQFALAPRLVEQRTDREWVIFDSDELAAAPEIATREGWTLVADLHNGVKLFRTVPQD